MEAHLTIFEKDREKITQEITQCQSRIIQTLVPTILAFGLISISDPANIGILTLGCAFAILFSASIYVASLSQKIFINASFLKVFDEPFGTEKFIYWEKAISFFRKRVKLPLIIKSETTTSAMIFTVLALTYFFIFFQVNLIATIVTTVILLYNSFRIFWIFQKAKTYDSKWKEVKVEDYKI